MIRRRPFSPFSPVPLPPPFRPAGEVAEADLVEGQKGVALGADVDEGGLDRRMDAPNDPLVDVPLQVLPAEGFDLEGLELAVVNDPDAALLRVGDVDEHDLGHTGLEPPPHHYPRRPITRWCRAANESSTS